MLIQAIREYVQTKQVVSFAQLHREFSIERQHLQNIWDRWLEQGKIELITPSASCGSACISHCGNCIAPSLSLYRWCKSSKYYPENRYNTA